MAIWDAPSGTPTVTHIPPPVRESPVQGFEADRFYGRANGRPFWSGDKRGVYADATLGEVEQARALDVQQQYVLRPQMLARVRGAFRAVFGR